MSTVEGSFSNKSLRSRKRRSSSDNSIESSADHSKSCSDIWEPLRKSRRLSENTANLCQKESSEPDESDAADKTMDSSEENVTLPVEKSPSLDLRELSEGVAGEETTSLNESEINSSTCNVTVASELATAEETYSEDDVTVPMEKRSDLNLRELTEEVDRDDTTVIDASEITPSASKVTAASEVATAEETCSEDNATVPMEKCSDLHLRELTEEEDIDDTTVIDAGEITPSTGNAIVASELATAEEKSSGINITLPLEKCSTLDIHESSEVLRTQESRNVYGEITASSHSVITGQDLFIAADEYFEGNITPPMEKVSLVDEADPADAIVTDTTTSKDEIEIAASLNDISEAPHVFFGVDGSAEDITLPLEKVSSLEVLKPGEAISTDQLPVSDESEAAEVLMAGETSSKAYISLPVEKLSLPEVHGLVEVVATGETTNLEVVETTACAYDGSVITAEKALSDDSTLPVENIASLEVHQPTEAVARDETTNFDDGKIAATTCDGTPAVQGRSQDKITLSVEKISSLEVHEPTKAVVSEEAINFEDDKIAATTGDGTPAVQGRSQDKITLPVEKISSLEVHEPTKAVVSEEAISFADDKIAAITCDGTPAVQGRSQDKITLPVEKISSLEVHEPTKAVVSEVAISFDDDKIAATTGDGTPAVQGRSQDKITQPVEKVSSLDVHEPDNSVATKETTSSDDSKITTYNYDVNETCKQFLIPLAQLSACRFHCNTYIVSFLHPSFSGS